MSFRPEYEIGAFKQLGQKAVQTISQVLTLLRGGLTWHHNHRIYTVTHTFGGVADTSEDVSISGLTIDWTPSYAMAIETNDGAVVYPASTAHTGWSSTVVKMKSSKANTVAVITVW